MKLRIIYETKWNAAVSAFVPRYSVQEFLSRFRIFAPSWKTIQSFHSRLEAIEYLSELCADNPEATIET